MSNTATLTPVWLRSRPFDIFFLFGITAISIMAGVIAGQDAYLLQIILFIQMWFIGFHHVIATYTRFLDKRDRQEHKWLITWLPLIVIASVLTIGYSLGIWALATIYIYWQFFHYTRQCHGVGQAYRHKGGKELIATPPILHQLLIYALPAWGILYRSAQGEDTFMTMPIKFIPEFIATPLAIIASIVTAFTIIFYIGFLIQTKIKKQNINLGYHSFIVSHLFIFYFSYLWMDNINSAWLALNMWHSLQYILFVFHFNKNRYKDEVSPDNVIISTLLKKNFSFYFIACITFTIVFYSIVKSSIYFLSNYTSLEYLLVYMTLYQTLNFHHYIADSYIWKMRKKKIQQVLETKE